MKEENVRKTARKGYAKIVKGVNSFTRKHIVRSHLLRLNDRPTAVFELFDPIGEKKWSRALSNHVSVQGWELVEYLLAETSIV